MRHLSAGLQLKSAAWRVSWGYLLFPVIFSPHTHAQRLLIASALICVNMADTHGCLQCWIILSTASVSSEGEQLNCVCLDGNPAVYLDPITLFQNKISLKMHICECLLIQLSVIHWAQQPHSAWNMNRVLIPILIKEHNLFRSILVIFFKCKTKH